MDNKIWGLATLLAVCITSTNLRAQEVFFRLGGGYAFKGATATFPEATATQVRANHISLGRGGTFQLAGGYMFSEHFGAELGLGYLAGAKNNLGDISELNGDAEAQGNSFSIAPSLVVRGAGEKIVPYARFGFVAAFNKAMIDASGSMSDPDFGTFTTQAEYELTGGLGTGFTAAMGANYKLNDRVALYAEANLLQMSWAPKKGELTRLSAEGINLLTELTVSDKEIEFVDELPTENTEPQDPNKPTQQLKTKLPMSNVGISVGLMVHF